MYSEIGASVFDLDGLRVVSVLGVLDVLWVVRDWRSCLESDELELLDDGS